VTRINYAGKIEKHISVDDRHMPVARLKPEVVDSSIRQPSAVPRSPRQSPLHRTTDRT